MLVSDLFKESMGIIGAIAIDEMPTVSEFNTCMTTCNMMLDSWSVQSLMVRAATQEPFSLIAGQAAYTIGAGANFNTGKPIKVLGAFIRDSSNLDTPIMVVEKDLYDSYTDKLTATGLPEAICYDPGRTQQATQTGTIFVYPAPDAAGYQLVIESQKYLTEFANLTDAVTFEPAYFEAIAWNLAVRIWTKFNRTRPLPETIAAVATGSKRTIQKMNASIPTCSMDLPGTKSGGGYNIYTDGR